MKIHVAVASDIGALDSLNREVFSESDRFDRARLRYFVTKARGFVLLATPAQSRCPALGLVVVLQRGQVARLHALGVVPAHRRHGIGTELLGQALRIAGKRGAEVALCDTRATNVASQVMLKRAGFAELALVPNFYADGEASLRFSRHPRLPN